MGKSRAKVVPAIRSAARDGVRQFDRGVGRGAIDQFEGREVTGASVRESADPSLPAGRRQRERAVVQDGTASQQHVPSVGTSVTASATPIGVEVHSSGVDLPAPWLRVLRRRRPRGKLQRCSQRGGVGECLRQPPAPPPSGDRRKLNRTAGCPASRLERVSGGPGNCLPGPPGRNDVVAAPLWQCHLEWRRVRWTDPACRPVAVLQNVEIGAARRSLRDDDYRLSITSLSDSTLRSSRGFGGGDRWVGHTRIADRRHGRRALRSSGTG